MEKEEKLLVFAKEFGWEWLCINKKLSEDFISKYDLLVDWKSVSKYQALTEDFIEKYCNNIDWYFVSQYQELSEFFIEKHSDKVFWAQISIHQNLSNNFVEKYKDRMHWQAIEIFQNRNVVLLTKDEELKIKKAPLYVSEQIVLKQPVKDNIDKKDMLKDVVPTFLKVLTSSYKILQDVKGI